ncbi:MAG: hypothetical protein BWK79_02840 [Beggiatoa sp. IS2]|nr:MAG: hypothetical protein BWK79_02840 [Beggiatoa sp. IS2]
MPVTNIRRPLNEQYDPKQRIIGGIVLFLLVLLLYSFLKLVLGISAGSEGAYRLPEPLPSEVGSDGKVTANPNTQTAIRQPVLLPKDFVFLDLNGNPMQRETFVQDNSAIEEPSTATGNKKWYVQVASFKEEERAQALAQKIKDRKIATEVTIEKSNDTFIVRLPVQDSADAAKQQKSLLSKKLNIRAKVKEAIPEPSPQPPVSPLPANKPK